MIVLLKRVAPKGILMLFLALTVATGCGYHVAGSPRAGSSSSSSLPEGVKRLSIPYFQNLTSRPGIEASMTTAFTSEFINIASIVEEAPEARLTGIIKRYELKPVSFTGSDLAQQYRLYVTLSVSLVRLSDGRVLWHDSRIERYDDILVDTANIAATRDAEARSYEAITRDLSRLVRERILEGY